jgi:hypothetical protein
MPLAIAAAGLHPLDPTSLLATAEPAGIVLVTLDSSTVEQPGAGSC